ncbi:hypothetical protein GCM10027610_100090 [Dactylosporangium cerinum]
MRVTNQELPEGRDSQELPKGRDRGGSLEASVRSIERAAGALATASVARMDETLPWFRELPADQRAWVMLVAQAGVRSLVEWLRNRQEGGALPPDNSDEFFDAAPGPWPGRSTSARRSS